MGATNTTWKMQLLHTHTCTTTHNVIWVMNVECITTTTTTCNVAHTHTLNMDFLWTMFFYVFICINQLWPRFCTCVLCCWQWCWCLLWCCCWWWWRRWKILAILFLHTSLPLITYARTPVTVSENVIATQTTLNEII